jgi:hypothetical protein
MGRAKDVPNPALFCEFSEACRDAVDFIVKTGGSAMELRNCIDSFKGMDVPVWAMDDAEDMLVEVVSRRLDEAVVHTKVHGKRAGVGELEMLSDAINDRKACKPGREPTLLVKEAENTYANLEAVLLNARRQNDIGTYGPLSPRANKGWLKPKDQIEVTFARLYSEVDVLMKYLEDPRLTSDSKASACSALLKIIQSDPVTTHHLVPKILKVLPKTMEDPDPNLQTRGHNVFVEMLMSQFAVQVCCRCLKDLANSKPALRTCRPKLSMNQSLASRCFREILTVYTALIKTQFAKKMHSGVLPGVAGLEMVARKFKSITRKLALSPFIRVVDEMVNVYCGPHSTLVDKVYAPTIALRVQQLNRELEGAWEQLAMWVAKVPPVPGRPDVLARTMLVWKRRTDPLPLEELVDGFSDYPATFPH